MLFFNAGGFFGCEERNNFTCHLLIFFFLAVSEILAASKSSLRVGDRENE